MRLSQSMDDPGLVPSNRHLTPRIAWCVLSGTILSQYRLALTQELAGNVKGMKDKILVRIDACRFQCQLHAFFHIGCKNIHS